MKIEDNFSLFNLFLDKHVKITVDGDSFKVRVPTIKELSLNDQLNAAYHLWILPQKKLKTIAVVPFNSSFEFLNGIIFHLGIYKEYSEVAKNFREALEFFIPGVEIDFSNKQITIEGITMTEEVWNYILYVLKLSCGEKEEKPRTFISEEDRQMYLAQKEMEEQIKRIKSQKKGDSDGLLKSFLVIQYAFNLSFEYLGEQTLAQIHWLHTHAAGAVSYEVNAQAFAAGNVKKGKKLDFFIK